MKIFDISLWCLKKWLIAVYTFYDCDAEARSLGTYAVLWQINEAKRLEWIICI